MATETRLLRFNVETGAHEDVAPLEADNPGKPAPTTVGQTLTAAFGSAPWPTRTHASGHDLSLLQRRVRPSLRKSPSPTAICFTPDKSQAYYCDTIDNLMKRVSLDADGWPTGDPEVWLDLSGKPFGADGAVIDADGNIWNAQWNGWRIAKYAPDGTSSMKSKINAAHTSCPAFGGPGPHDALLHNRRRPRHGRRPCQIQ